MSPRLGESRVYHAAVYFSWSVVGEDLFRLKYKFCAGNLNYYGLDSLKLRFKLQEIQV